ncbi:hypothetical protein SDRG_08806 [Saprolegnia diclina VS20]|uniref:RING-type domain-containing protein n=1 Tax=Saprolegnia diclina (strain VS20) TaxID=1156394 RepID=T0RTN9_SAPDV|nr:hypothetical protein SDRG_08806 [Saprolegnia diclina VS20]EQC33702.1 hypothetical protein SDRG_08806 [Saprolegnia diclina VS20]|eukprot:XP_008612925.1 hypothetical protein SDRG_08806 [Saprolegnia diclina VS20]
MQQQQYKSPLTTATTSTVPNEPAMAFVPLAKWSTAVSPATAAARSRNIDIPNSKPRLRTKPAVAPSSTAGLSRVAAPAKRPSSGSHAASSASTIDACFKWHSRPPRGHVETSGTKPSPVTPFQRHEDQAAKLKRTKKAKSVTAPRRLSTDHMWNPPSWTQAAHSTSTSKGDGVAHCRGDPQDMMFRPAATATLRAREAEPPPPPPVATTADGLRSNDVVENLARALLTDCINKRQRETLKSFKVEIVESPPVPSSSSSSCGGASCCGSPKEKAGVYDDSGGGLSCSSSDDELNHLHAMDPSSFVWDESGRPDDAKPWRETAVCHDVDPMLPTSSPESDCFYEEKGLSKEVRYSLPIAYGTVHETSKQCTICQLAYEIGSHIVTLTPCQHFFHALCVDKWLWNHTTCPLCRKEVVYEAFGGVRGTACPDEDRESLRKKMRSQCAEFRPLNPLPVDTLDVHFSSLQLQDSRRPPAVTPLDYLVCPVAQRTWRK